MYSRHLDFFRVKIAYSFSVGISPIVKFIKGLFFAPIEPNGFVLFHIMFAMNHFFHILFLCYMG